LVWETGFFDVNFEPEHFRLRDFSRREMPQDDHRPRRPSQTESFLSGAQGAAFPALNLSVAMDGGASFACTGFSNYETARGEQYPVRVQKDGRFQSNVDMTGLRFQQTDGAVNYDLLGYFEVVVWPRCISFAASVSSNATADGFSEWPPDSFSLELEVALDGEISRHTASVAAGEGGNVHLQFCMDANGRLERIALPPAAVEIEVRPKGANADAWERAFYNSSRGSWIATLPTHTAKAWPVDLAELDDYSVNVVNPTSESVKVHLEFWRPDHQHNIIGVAPVLLLPNGMPSGLPLQVSKNWHEGDVRWLSISTVFEIAALTSASVQLRVAYAEWGGLPSVSHAQLSLIGRGAGHGVWHESALGSFGEGVCYSPNGQSTRSVTADVRPESVCAMGSTPVTCKQFGWTEDVGGGDFLVVCSHSSKCAQFRLSNLVCIAVCQRNWELPTDKAGQERVAWRYRALPQQCVVPGRECGRGYRARGWRLTRPHR
jgi:hypothetical protein